MTTIRWLVQVFDARLSTRAILAAALLCATRFALYPEQLFALQSSDTLELDPIVVTATRIPTLRTAVASTVTVLDGDALRAEGKERVLDALRRVPGLNVVQSGSFGSATSVLMRGGESDYVKVLIDGVPVNDPGGAFDFAHLTLDNVDRIEVVRGPASVLYGSDAIVGVVEIFTRRGRGRPQAEIGARAGTYESVSVDGGFAAASEGASVALAVSRSSTAGIYAFNNDYDHLELSGLARVAPDDVSDASIMLRYSDGDFHYPTDGSGRLVDENSFQRQQRVVASLQAGRFVTDWLETRAILAFNETDGGIDDAVDGPADTLGFFGFRSDQRIQRRSADVRANVFLPRATVLTAGVSFERQLEVSTNESRSQFGDSEGAVDVKRNTSAYYVQGQSQLLDRLSLNAGIRADDNQAFGRFVTYRSGATYRFASDTRVRASVGKAFKEPTFFENFSETPFALGNPDLTPERSTAWEIGIEQQLLKGRVRVGVAYFDQRFRDLIQYTAAPPDPAGPYFFNVAAANATGLELDGALHLGSLDLGAGYTYLETEVTDAGFATGAGAAFVAGEKLLRRPSHSLNAHANYRFSERADLGLDVNHVGSRDDRDFSGFPASPVVLAAYTRVDVSFGVRLIPRGGRRPAVDLRARVNNLFDTDYQEVFGFPSRTRVVSVGARVAM